MIDLNPLNIISCKA